MRIIYMNINKRYKTIYYYATKKYIKYWIFCFENNIIRKEDNPEIWTKKRYYARKRSVAIKEQRAKNANKVYERLIKKMKEARL